MRKQPVFVLWVCGVRMLYMHGGGGGAVSVLQPGLSGFEWVQHGIYSALLIAYVLGALLRHKRNHET